MTMLLLIVLFTYLAIITRLYGGFMKVKPFRITDKVPQTKFTVVVPFRNEAENLPTLLESFSKLNYPETFFEVILVDDGSEDQWSVASSQYSVRIVANNRVSASPKKDAILTAITIAKHDWIITTDADCIVNENWLLCYDNFIRQKEAEMVAGAVAYNGNKSFSQAFQQLDIASLQAATIGSFGIGRAFMCNGANFAYTKNLFEKLNGFDGNTDFAGGDDVFLLQKAMRQFPEKVHYLKAAEAIVNTKPENTWKKLFFQRVRWASKASGYQSVFAKLLGILVFSTNCFWLLAFGFWLFHFFSFDFRLSTFDFVILTIVKFAADYFVIAAANKFLEQKTRWFLLGSLVYPFFSTAVVVYSFFGKFEWKGRKFKK